MNWFERLTGFTEGTYEVTRAKLAVEGLQLRSLVNDRRYGIGTFEMVSLADLRDRVRTRGSLAGHFKVSTVNGDVGPLHRAPEFTGALFQVASQFNMLEMPGPSVTPEAGVTGYANDHTQGPACAMAAGAATIFRNYFVPVGGRLGQTSAVQLNGLADVGASLALELGADVETLWAMRNGYALCTEAGLGKVATLLASASEERKQSLSGMLRLGLHSNVEVTSMPETKGPNVSQLFCSALPLNGSRIPKRQWAPFAQMILDSAYEATVLAGVLNARSGGSNVVLLTRLGGDAFGNDDRWIDASMRRAVELAKDFALEVRIVCFTAPTPEESRLVKDFS